MSDQIPPSSKNKRTAHRPKGVDFWRKHVQQWLNSGFSQTQYCRENKLSIGSFGHWKIKLVGPDDDTPPVRKKPLLLPVRIERKTPPWPHAFLDGYEGFLQADAFSGYQGLYESGNIIEVACVAHCRRKFYEASRATKDNSRAHYALLQISKIYQVEWACKDMKDDQRKIYRVGHAKPILDNFKTWAED